MKFRFPLLKVMQHRKTLEDVAQREFQVAVAKLNFERTTLETMIDSKRQARQGAYQTQVQGGSPAHILTQVHEFLLGQDLRIVDQNKRIEEQQRIVEEFREILRQRATDRKIMEGLRDRKELEFKVEVKKREQKNQDDLSIMRYKTKDDE